MTPSQAVGRQQKFGTSPIGFRIGVSCWDGFCFCGIMNMCPLKIPEMELVCGRTGEVNSSNLNHSEVMQA